MTQPSILPPPHESMAPDSWSRALSLNERIERARLAASLMDDPGRLAEGEARLAEWRQSTLAGEDLFQEKLRLAAASERELAWILGGDPVVAGGDRWPAVIEEIVADLHPDEALPPLQPRNGAAGPEGELPFAGLLRPLLQSGLHRLRRGVAALERRAGGSLLSAWGEAGMLQALAERAFSWSGPTLILELNVARVEGRLRGDDAPARLRDFSTRILGGPEGKRTLFAEYPVLARLLTTAVELWVEAMLELVERFAADRAELARAFPLPEGPPGALAAVHAGLSDAHRRGRGVLQVELSSGLKLIYKPKSMAVESRFQELLGWLEEAGLRHPHRRLQVLDRGDYGWVELVAAGPCDSPAAVERFFWRQGSFLALLYALRAADFHYENLIAAGEHPILVDLESLFHHRSQEASTAGTALDRARRKLDESVYGVGLLPVMIWGGGGRKGVDLSGLGGRAGEAYPHLMPMLVDGSADTMRIERRELRIQRAHNRPTLDGRDADPTRHVEVLVEGFRETYSLLEARRGELMPLAHGLASLEMRHIPRPTMRYGLFLQEGLHPDYLRDALDRDRLLDKLWAEAATRPELIPLVPSEQEDLWQGDIPFFTFRPREKDLWDSRGRRLAGFFPESSWSAVEELLGSLGAADREEQVSILRQSMLVLDTGHATASPSPSPRQEEPAGRPASGEYLAAAEGIGDLLARRAILGDDDVSWIAASLRAELDWRWVLSPLESSVYEGLGGLTLFLGFLGDATGRGDFADLARRGATALERFLAAADPLAASNIGPFSGRAGQIYVLSHLARLWNEPAILERALATLPKLDEQVPRDRNLDLMGGSAGCAVVMLDLYRQTGDPRLLDVARRCGDRLLETACPQKAGGLGWIGSSAAEPLSGFAHGVAGIVWSLLRLADVLGDERYREAALQGLIYERSLFVPQARNWMDLRRFEEAPKDFKSLAWCHGAPGIALGRLLGLPLFDGPEVREEIRLGIEETLAQGFGANHSLCHGDLGNAGIVLHAAEVLGEPAWREAALDAAARVCRQVQAGKPRCGLPRHTEAPGLMTGLSGIGYGLLRHAASGVPDILRLAPPAPATT